MEYSPQKINEIINKNNFKFKKKYGQNFIIDENIINSIINKSNINKDTMIIEIGPGAGSLTNKLCKVAKNVLCYEIDDTLKPILDDLKKTNDNLEIIYKDFLKADIENDIKKYIFKDIYVIANLPYYITTPIIIKIIEENISVSKIVVMVQKEVGDRFKAKPGTKDYGSLSVYLNYYYDIKKVLDVSRNVFIPKPNVDSIVVSFEKKNNNYELNNKELFFKLVRDSFTQKRKTLKNNLKSYNLEKISNVLERYGYDLSVRAEELSIEIFVDIANNL
ncbi:MAG TPA: 16S rRNA (adenine(1518)-N(6)/adenine(1519)-N(6))-dimethyltransferase RsmA [Tenericutes bacterium]|nr:16S rRNA (adenine(1518)-N(6)/adenine(1519)-N(6))-dimethyltransferase RsmA [Mycoplasmatota bacterium]